jgi:predicted metal-dependent peptidase
MSSGTRSSVTKDLVDKEAVPSEEKASGLSTAIYDCVRSHPFMGSVLQCLNISFSHVIPTAGIMFNTDAKRWDMLVNPYFFCKKLSAQNRKAVLLHELSHITHKHPFRVPFLQISPRKRMLMNIAADMAINQFIQGLPTGCPQCPPVEQMKPCPNEMCPGRCIDVKDYHDVDEKNSKKMPWQVNQTMEFYYEKLLTKFEDPDDDEDGEGDGQGEGQGQGNAGGGASSKDLPKTIDEHMWDAAGDEKDMLDATEDLIKRAMVKSKFDYDDLPAHVREMLEDIKSRKAELNYKALIMSAMKKHAAGHSRKNTWTRRSKRFGNKAPGTKVGDLPKLFNYIDTSGSISIEEANEFLEIVDQFLKVGSRKCKLGMFHTDLYYTEEYKIGKRIDRSDIQNGGTELTSTMQHILKNRPDLSVILTDGYYGNVEVEQWMKPGERFPQCLFIISKNGTEEHPLARLGQTVKISDSSTKRSK